jgi:Fe-Mn family superoxide dismutase
MSQPTRREMLGTLGTMAAVGGWIGLSEDQALAQSASGLPTPKEYVVVPLPYAYDALEPYIDKETMTLHHDKHYAGYVKGLNEAIAGLAAARKGDKPEDIARVRGLTDSLSFNGCGTALHEIFWTNMKKGGGGEPKGMLAQAIARDFGSFDAFMAQFNETALKVQASGWGILAWEPLSGRLITLGPEKHQNMTFFGCVPLMVLDVWEHAYYLKYQNRRGDYIKAWANVINWDNVADRLNRAMKLTA